MAICILLVDDQPLVRRGLRMFLSLDAELKVIGEATNGYEAIELSHQLKPDVILMDLMMPKMNGVEATARLRSQGVTSMIIALSHSQERDMIDAVLESGANVFFSKDVQTENLIAAIKAAFRS